MFVAGVLPYLLPLEAIAELLAENRDEVDGLVTLLESRRMDLRQKESTATWGFIESQSLSFSCLTNNE